MCLIKPEEPESLLWIAWALAGDPRGRSDAGVERGQECPDGRGGDREADALRAALGAGRARAGEDLGVHADYLAGGVEQRTARVAGVQRGVGLDDVGDGCAVGGLDLAVQRRDDARRERPVQPEGGADRVGGGAPRAAARGAGVALGARGAARRGRAGGPPVAPEGGPRGGGGTPPPGRGRGGATPPTR